MIKPIVFVVNLDDMLKLTSITASSVASKLAELYIQSQAPQELVVAQADVISAEGVVSDTRKYKVMYTSRTNNLNSSNRTLIPVHIA